MRHIYLIRLGLSLWFLLLIGCTAKEDQSSRNANSSTEASVPNKSIDQAAVKTAIQSTLGYRERLTGSSEAECKDFSTKRSLEMPVSAADRANGVEEKWCLELAFACRTRPNSSWFDVPNVVKLRRSAGGWSGDNYIGSSGWELCTKR